MEAAGQRRPGPTRRAAVHSESNEHGGSTRTSGQPARGVGSRSAATRAQLITATKRLLLADGYAAITYRSVATAAGVTPGLVQYHFPLMDQLFEAVLETGTDRLVERLARAADSAQPLRTIWAYARDPAGTALLLEFMAMARHRKSIAPALGAGGERLRKALLDTLEPTLRQYRLAGQEIPASALLFLMSAIPRMMHLEESLGTHTGHAEVVELVERYLDQVEPREQEAP